MVTEHASAKINLFLHVGDKRADGFHPLQSLAVFTAMGDVLSMEPAFGLSLTIEGPFAKGLDGEGDNLVLRAAKSLSEKSALDTQGAKLILTKNLPVASGIGGGSADAAAALRGLNQLWNLDRSEAVLRDLAAGLGSDIPVCVLSASCFMEGRGEVLRAAQSMPRVPMLLVNPGVAVPTKDVFAALAAPALTAPAQAEDFFAINTDAAALVSILAARRNDLEIPAIKLQAVIVDVLKALQASPHCLLARMSGSGATCFGLFGSAGAAQDVARQMQADHPRWWVRATSFG